MILGLTGSIGSGKSFVTTCFERLGALTVRADEIAREVIALGSSGYNEVIEAFGSQILRDDGTIDRPKLAGIVFSDNSKRKVLESIIHPRVRQREIELIEEYRQHPLVVLDIPLLFESGAQEICDKVLVVTLEEPERRKRLRKYRGMSDEEIDRRLAGQMPQEEKVRRADFLINNSGSMEETEKAVRELYRQLVE